MIDPIFLLGQQSTMPQVDGWYFVQLLSRMGHIIGAIILVGGLFYMRTIVAATAGSSADQLFGAPRAKWAKWVGIATALLLATGLINYVMMIKQHERLASSYHMIAGLKMLASLVAFLLAALLAGRSSLADLMRARWPKWITVVLVVALIPVLMGSVLRTYPRTRKVEPTSAPVLMAPTNHAVR
ncbi:MAG: hypothetical protein IT425_14195 [Pirellulales bacterium]|nr:hypothetical protein [Pirellulales bacterium]